MLVQVSREDWQRALRVREGAVDAGDLAVVDACDNAIRAYHLNNLVSDCTLDLIREFDFTE